MGSHVIGWNHRCHDGQEAQTSKGRDIPTLVGGCFSRNLLKTYCSWDGGAKKKPVNNGISTINLNWLHSQISGFEVLWIQFVVLKQNLGFFSSRVGLSGGSDMT